MFGYYNESNLYDRCGVIDIPYEVNPQFHKFTYIHGEKIHIMSGVLKSGIKFTRTICLKTKFGYIPIENITRYRDLYDLTKYCHDETEWCIQYCEECASKKEKDDVKKLSSALGRHWKVKKINSH